MNIFKFTHLVSRCHRTILLNIVIITSSSNSDIVRTKKWRLNRGVTSLPPAIGGVMAHIN